MTDTVNVGTVANDGTGDTLRQGGINLNASIQDIVDANIPVGTVTAAMLDAGAAAANIGPGGVTDTMLAAGAAAANLTPEQARTAVAVRGPEIQLGTLDIDATGVADCATVINNAAAAAAGRKLILPPGTFRMNSKLLHHQSRAIIEGQGRRTQILFNITDLGSDLVEVGDGSIAIVQPILRDLLFYSTAIKTGGWTVNARLTYGYIEEGVYYGDDTLVDPLGVGNRLWGGLFLDRFFNPRVWGGQSFALAKHVAFRGNADGSFGQEAYIGGNRKLRFGTHDFHLGGGTGGIYLGRVDAAEADLGILIDNTLQSAINRELFMAQDCVIDSCGDCGAKVDQALASTAQFFFRGWISSTQGTGNAIDIVNANGARIMVSAKIYNNVASGVVIRDAAAVVEVSPPASFDGNGAYDINPTTAITSLKVAPGVAFRGSVSGDFNTSAMDRPVQDVNALSARHNPGTSWSLDVTSGAALSIASGATSLLHSGGGFLMLNDDANGDGALYHVGGGNVTKIGGSASFVAGAPGASQIGVAYNGGATRYEIGNGYAGTRTIRVANFRTRSTA